MGIFSTIGGLFGKQFGPLGSKVGAGIGGLIDKKVSHSRTSGGEISTNSTRVNFQQLADDARAAGFNPLTALRTTGGMGNIVTKYTSPLIDHGSFGIKEALSGAYSGYQNYMGMEQQKQKFGLETDLIKSQIALNTSNAMPKVVEDVWGKYNDTNNKVPANYLGTDLVIPKSLAEFMRIKPFQSLGAGQITELLGEGTEIGNFFSSAGQQRTFGIDLLGRRANSDENKPTLFNFLSPDGPKPNPRPFSVSNNVVQFNSNEIIKVSKIPILSDLNNNLSNNSDKVTDFFNSITNQNLLIGR